ncbi:hypothetical protein U9M48_015621 [Paspalum notatum var. saurae]|uniref:Uncharacterized protein n=1 Tax=Paspalum notatum var. saurae TaxID=547442 RepID=A0AAQ3WLX7_PASNO
MAAAAADSVADALTSTAVSSDSDSDDLLLLLLPNLLPSTAAAAPSSPSCAQLHHFHIPSLPSPITVRALPSRGISFQLWPSAATLLRVLPASPQLLPRAPPLSVLELGSGTGAAGLALAAALPARAVLSDLPDALPNLRHNADLNAPLLAGAGAAASVVPLPWGDAAAMEEVAAAASEAAPFDLVVASDVVYYEALVDPLIETLRFFVKGDVVFLMAHMRRWKRTDKKFFAKARKAFDVEVVHEDPPLEGWRHGPVVYRFTAKKQQGKKSEIVVRVCTPEPYNHQAHSFMVIKCTIKPPINRIKDLISSIEIPHPLNQFDLIVTFLQHNRIEHDIAWLDITVQDTLLPLFMEVQESRCNANALLLKRPRLPSVELLGTTEGYGERKKARPSPYVPSVMRAFIMNVKRVVKAELYTEMSKPNPLKRIYMHVGLGVKRSYSLLSASSNRCLCRRQSLNSPLLVSSVAQTTVSSSLWRMISRFSLEILSYIIVWSHFCSGTGFNRKFHQNKKRRRNLDTFASKRRK